MFKKKRTSTVSAKAVIEEIFTKLEEAGCDPITELASMAVDKTIPLDTRVGILKELASYIAPKRKAVDVVSHEEDGVVVKVVKYSKGTTQLEKMCDPEVLKAERDKNRIIDEAMEEIDGDEGESEETQEATG